MFLSYSTKDHGYLRRLIDALAEQGVPCWHDHEIRNGQLWETQLRAHVDGCAALVVVMSPEAEQSPWVRLEVGRALFQRRPVHPILLAGQRFGWLKHLQDETGPDQTVTPGEVLPSTRFVEVLRAAVADPVPVRAPAGPVRRLPTRSFPARNRNFVGRDQLMLDLETGLYWGTAAGPRPGPVTVTVQALHGTGGVGKTQLAVEYAHRRSGDYDLIVWLDAEQPALLAPQLANLAPVLNVLVGDDATQTARAVLDGLERTGLRWLLVYDNAEHAHTSRRPGWSHLGATVEVDVLTPTEAFTLLTERAHPVTVDASTAAVLVELLGFLPLAVEQAAGYLRTTRTPATNYLRLLRERGEDLLEDFPVPGYEHTIATVWDVSQNSLREVSPAADQLLRLCAFLGPEPIPLDLFTGHPDLLPDDLADAVRDETAFNRVIAALLDRSLAHRSPDGTTITIHRLLAAAIRRPLTEPVRHAAAAIARILLYAELPREIQNAPQNWPAWQAMLPHALTAADHPSAEGDLDDRNRSAGLLGTAASYLQVIGRRDEALTYSQQALTIRQDLAQANPAAYLPNLATSLTVFAMILGMAEDGRPQAIEAAQSARSIFAQLDAAVPGAFTDRLATTDQLLQTLQSDDDPDPGAE